MSENCKIKVTVMIPTFNQQAYIREAIDSALAQTYPNLEIIVGDDSSTDRTAEIVAKINDPRLKCVFNKCNLGRVANYRNILYTHATGDYVINLDGDDYFTDVNFISNAVEIIANDSEVLIVAAEIKATIFSRDYIYQSSQFEKLRGLEILSRLPDYRLFFKHMGVLYHRNTALGIDFYRFDVVSTDWESLYRLSLRSSVVYLNNVIGVWRIHGMNESERLNSYQAQLNNLEIWPSIYKDAVIFGMNPVLAKFLIAKCIAFSSHLSVAKISLNGNQSVVKFLIQFIKKYPLATLIFVLNPKYISRFVLSLIGYYRIKSRIF